MASKPWRFTSLALRASATPGAISAPGRWISLRSTVVCFISLLRRTLELDSVALRVGKIDGDAGAGGAEARLDLALRHAVASQVRDDRIDVERLDAQAEMI